MIRYSISNIAAVICLVTLMSTAYIFNMTYVEHSSRLAKKNINQQIEDRRKMFLVFVGGMPRSGTTLMRTILDTHPLIRCGTETRVIPDILKAHSDWTRDTGLITWLSNAGVYPTALDNAMAQFILEVILRHGSPATYYCNKDPYVLVDVIYLRRLFPNSRYIMMIRDGRAFAHSVVSRGIHIQGYNNKNYRDVLARWSAEIQGMYSMCLAAGEDTCLPVKYETLVLQPVATTKRIFKFLEIPWDDIVLHHEDHLNETALSKVEYSTSQVVRPINLDALSSWHGKLPEDVVKEMSNLAPMLELLGYNPNDEEPNYGEPDDFVKKKMKILSETEKKTTLK